MKPAKKDAAIDCDAIRAAIQELQDLDTKFDPDDPEDVGSRIQAFASALKRSGLVEEDKDDERGKVLMSDVVEALPLKEFAPYLAEVELFELSISEYNEPDRADMLEGHASLQSFAPKLIAELERIEAEYRQTKAKSQPGPQPS
jgi:hypothetical protein